MSDFEFLMALFGLLYALIVAELAPERVNTTSQLIIPNNELQGRK